MLAHLKIDVHWFRILKMAQKIDVNFLRILKMAKSAAAAHVSLPVLLRPGTRSIHIKPPLPVIWHLEGFTFSETFRPQDSGFKTRFMNSICFRYVQPTIVVVKHMLCWAIVILWPSASVAWFFETIVSVFRRFNILSHEIFRTSELKCADHGP